LTCTHVTRALTIIVEQQVDITGASFASSNRQADIDDGLHNYTAQ